jgi:hypothetical protein
MTEGDKKSLQAYQVIGYMENCLLRNTNPSVADMTGALNYFSNAGLYMDDFLPWPKMDRDDTEWGRSL